MIELIGSTNVISNGHLKDSFIGLDLAQGKSGVDISVDGTRSLATINPLTISASINGKTNIINNVDNVNALQQKLDLASLFASFFASRPSFSVFFFIFWTKWHNFTGWCYFRLFNVLFLNLAQIAV